MYLIQYKQQLKNNININSSMRLLENIGIPSNSTDYSVDSFGLFLKRKRGE